MVKTELRALPVSGAPLLCEMSLSLVRDEAGEAQYGLCQAVDITAVRRDEARLARHVRCQGALAASAAMPSRARAGGRSPRRPCPVLGGGARG